MHRYSTLLLLAAFLLSTSSSAKADVITGAGPGAGSTVKTFSGATGAELDDFLAYPPAFLGGVRVAVGDVNGDGIADVLTGPGPAAGAPPQVQVFDGSSSSLLMSFFPYGPSFNGGVFVAAGDVNGDLSDDIVTGADAGGAPHVKVFNGQSGVEVRSFNAYPPSFAGGVRVAAGDVNGDGLADLVTGAGVGSSHVKVFDGATNAELRSFFAYGGGFTGGVYVASGDVDGDGYADIVTGADAGGAPHVKVFSGQSGSELLSFMAFTPSFTGGVRVAAGDVDGDGLVDIVTGAGGGAGGHVKVFSGQTGAELQSYLAYNAAFTGGVYVAASTLPIPEPGSVALAMAGVAGLLLRRRG